MAIGSEQNMLGALGAWGIAWAVHQLGRNGLTRLLLGLATAALGVIVYFFRDPDRPTVISDDLAVSPADGEVVAVVREFEGRYLNREVIRISVFLSILDVHVQRNPVSGRVTLIDHQPGQYLQAFRPEASDVNEYIAMIIEHETHGPILVKQIAGIMARRCVNHESVGHYVRSGDRFGMIRFGSRVDLYLPVEAGVLVAEGDRVLAGLTPIARMES